MAGLSAGTLITDLTHQASDSTGVHKRDSPGHSGRRPGQADAKGGAKATRCEGSDRPDRDHALDFDAEGRLISIELPNVAK